MSAKQEKAARETPADETYRPPYRAALLAGLGVFALYAITLAPTTQFWDTSEYIATAHILGIPHPPGNPLFVVLARAWATLLTPFGLSVAVQINLFSAVQSAAGARALVPGRAPRPASLLRARVVPTGGRRGRGAGQRHGVHGLEPVEREREGLHGLARSPSRCSPGWRSAGGEPLGEGKDDNLLVLIVLHSRTLAWATT